jgi:hypothetical protein
MHGTHPPAAPDDEEEAELPVTETSKQVLLAPGGKFRISDAADPGLVSEVCDGSPYGVSSPDSRGRTARGG